MSAPEQALPATGDAARIAEPASGECNIVDPPGLKGGPGAQARLTKERDEFVRKYAPPFAVKGDNPPMIVAKDGEALLSMMWPAHAQTPEGEKAAVDYTNQLATQIAESLNAGLTDAQARLAELERQLAEARELHRMASQNVITLDKQLAASEKDREQLDWLEKNRRFIVRITDTEVGWQIIMSGGRSYYAPSLRAAIDAATLEAR